MFTIQLDIPVHGNDTSTIANAINIAPPTLNICLPHAQEAVYSDQEMITFPISVPQTKITNHPPQTASSPPHQIEFAPENPPDNKVSENEDVNQYYEVETEPTPPDITELCTPITNYSRDQINNFDVQDGWEKI